MKIIDIQLSTYNLESDGKCIDMALNVRGALLVEPGLNLLSKAAKEAKEKGTRYCLFIFIEWHAR